MRRAIRLLGLLSALAPLITAQDPTPATKPPVPSVRVGVFEVVPAEAEALDTVRQSFRFGFTVERVVEDGAGLTREENGLVRDGRIGLRLYQGSDHQGGKDGKDAVSRLADLLETKRGERDPEHGARTPLLIGRKDQLRLTILGRSGARELWIFEREDGARVVIERRDN
ncbi:MAG: hypothetical protein U1F36_05500 [Planctomycetota bacterium]